MPSRHDLGRFAPLPDPCQRFREALAQGDPGREAEERSGTFDSRNRAPDFARPVRGMADRTLRPGQIEDHAGKAIDARFGAAADVDDSLITDARGTGRDHGTGNVADMHEIARLLAIAKNGDWLAGQ